MPPVPPVSWPWLLCAFVVGYLVGSVSPSALVARARGVDLRGLGSGNPGATNVGRVLGPRTGVLVGLADVAKGLVPALVFTLGVDATTGMVAGVAAVLGHCTSPWLRGRGGKGVATSFGAILGSAPWWALAGLAVFLVVVLVSRWVALASVAAALAVAVLAFVAWLPHDDPLATRRLVWALVLAGIVVFRHRNNFMHRRRLTGRPDGTAAQG